MNKTVALVAGMLSFNALADELKVATWNIYWLGDNKYNQRTSEDYRQLQHSAQQLNADVIALQEVGSADDARKVLGNDYAYYFSTRDADQRVGFAVKKTSDLTVDFSEYKALGVGNVRYGADLTVSRNNKSLRLLGVHLKSGCFSQSLSPDELNALPTKTDRDKYRSRSCHKLANQIQPLEDWVDQRARENQPYMLLGDFNRRFDSEERDRLEEHAGVWSALDDPENHNEDLLRLNANRTPQCWNSKYKDYIDHIIVDQNAAKLLKKDSFGELTYQQTDYRASYKRLSDHCPIYATFEL